MKLRFAFLFSISILVAGCGTFRQTVTPRSALEQALLAQAVTLNLDEFQIEDLEGQTFSINPQWLQAVDEEFILTAINRKLLEAGLNSSLDAEKSEIIVYPQVAYAGTDESDFLLGIPSLAIPLPFSAAPFETPELALYKLDRQYGRVQMGLYGVNRETGDLAFSVPMTANQAYYKLWTILFLINFDTTSLPEPYN